MNFPQIKQNDQRQSRMIGAAVTDGISNSTQFNLASWWKGIWGLYPVCTVLRCWHFHTYTHINAPLGMVGSRWWERLHHFGWAPNAQCNFEHVSCSYSMSLDCFSHSISHLTFKVCKFLFYLVFLTLTIFCSKSWGPAVCWNSDTLDTLLIWRGCRATPCCAFYYYCCRKHVHFPSRWDEENC